MCVCLCVCMSVLIVCVRCKMLGSQWKPLEEKKEEETERDDIYIDAIQLLGGAS